MKTNLSGLTWGLRLSLAVSLFTGFAVSGAELPPQPAITAIRLRDTNVVVTVEVPPGLRCVYLECRSQLGRGAWEPRAAQRLDGLGGQVHFTLSRAARMELMRVRALDRDRLPESFFRGTNVFAGPASVEETPSGGGPLAADLWYRAYGLEMDATAFPSGTVVPPESTPREVVESDIWKVRGTTVYYFNHYRGLQVIDVSQPEAPQVRAVFSLPAVGEQMYLLGDTHVILLAGPDCGTGPQTAESQVVVVNVASQPPVAVARLPVSGRITESRLVGSALYVVAQTYRPRTNGSELIEWEAGAQLASFDCADPDHPQAQPPLWLASGDNVVMATDRFFFATLPNPRAGDGSSAGWMTAVQCLDISSADGLVRPRGVINAVGRVADKFKMNLNGDVFAVASWGQTPDSTWGTTLETFSLADPDAPRKLGQVMVGQGEQLFATRFDGARAYVVTYRRIDPLWIIDLSDPARPRVAGELLVPGWSTFIYPWGERLITMGIDDMNGQRAAVQLFDVSDPARPALLSKVSLGEGYSWSEANQNEKALTVLPAAGLILVPYQGWISNGYATRVQLIDLAPNLLTARGAIEHRFQPRRATAIADHIFTVSSHEFLSIQAANRDRPEVSATLTLAWPINRVFAQGDYLLEVDDAAELVRVARVESPDTVLGLLRLTNGLPIKGACVHEGKLHLAQAQTPAWGYPWPYATLADGAITPASTAPATLFLSAVDLSALPLLTLLGSTSVAAGPFNSVSDLEPAWPRSDLLVWSGGGDQSWWWWWGWGRPINPVPMLAVVGGVTQPGPLVSFADSLAPVWIRPINPWSHGGSSERWLLACDVSQPASPRLASALNLGTNEGWNFSDAHAANGLLYLSHQKDDRSVTGTNYYVYTDWRCVLTTNAIRTNSPTGEVTVTTNESWDCLPVQVTNAWEVVTWTERHYLDVVDYTDPAQPTVRRPVNVPGRLQGLSRDGALLYTIGRRAETNKLANEEWLDASAYDELSASLVDSLLLPAYPRPVLVHQDLIHLGRPGTTNTTAQLETWTLDQDSGRFQQLKAMPRTQAADVLAAWGNLLAVLSDSQVGLFDAATVTPLGYGAAPACLGLNLPRGDGDAARGLWVPMSDYGVQFIPVAQPGGH
jgi:hypothetical protein